uniref:GTD-binding domain-containing protein n=1 Tax=Oryza rufipogon TaxID=4529 RepID=A0A0E0RHF4_ORYRU
MRTCHHLPPSTATATAAAAGEPPPPLCPLCGHPAASYTSSSSSSPSPSQPTARPPLKRKAPPEAPPAVVRVEIGDEAAALREALARQHGALADLQAELDAERGAAAGAASEAMTMILRLQREKAEAMMEARQFRRYAEEKMSHDAAELAALEDLLAKRDAALRALQSSSSSRGGGGGRGVGGGSGRATPSFPGSSPHHYPSTPTPASAAAAANYPPLRCFIDHPPTASEADALDAQTPREHLTRLAHRVHMLERGVHPMATTTTTTPIIRVAPGSAFPRPTRAYSDADSLEFCDGEYFPDDVDCGASDRVYTVDAIHGRPLAVPEGSCTPGGSSCCGGGGVPWAEDEEMRRLSARLQALEADRETMRQAIVSMGAEKAQVVLLKEIAQQLCKEATPPLPPSAVTVGHHLYKGAAAPPAVTVKMRPPRPPVVMHRRVIDAPPAAKTSYIGAVAKWFTSIVSRYKKTPRTKYPIGQCGNNVGLLLLLDKAPRPGHGHQKMPKKI